MYDSTLYGENVFVLRFALHLLSARTYFCTANTCLEKGYEITYKTLSHSYNGKKAYNKHKYYEVSYIKSKLYYGNSGPELSLYTGCFRSL